MDTSRVEPLQQSPSVDTRLKDVVIASKGAVTVQGKHSGPVMREERFVS